MSSAAEITTAFRELRPQEQFELMLHLAEIMRTSGARFPMPSPREYSEEEMQKWIEEDERDGRELREKL
jgi:hypothetical protein